MQVKKLWADLSVVVLVVMKNPEAKHGLTTLKPETRRGLLSVLDNWDLLLALCA